MWLFGPPVGGAEATVPPGEHRVRMDINIDVCTLGVSTSGVDARKTSVHASSDTQQVTIRQGEERRAARRPQEAEGHRQEANPSAKPAANRRPNSRGHQRDA